MSSRTRTSTGLLILGAVLTACGGAATPTSPAGSAQRSSAPAPTLAPAQTGAASNSTSAIDACALITEPEATAFLGSDPGAGVNSGSADSPACAYDGSLTIGVDPTGGRALFDGCNSGNPEILSGVGDGAYATIVANSVAAMEILKGSVVVSVNVQGDPSLQNITPAALTALGKIIANRL